MNYQPHKGEGAIFYLLFHFPWPLGILNWRLLMGSGSKAALVHPGWSKLGEKQASLGPCTFLSEHWHHLVVTGAHAKSYQRYLEYIEDAPKSGLYSGPQIKKQYFPLKFKNFISQ